MRDKKVWCLAFTLGGLAGMAGATEAGGSTYPRGVENYMVGAAPPPGVYWLGYFNHYSADEQKDARGGTVPVPGFKVNATAAVLRAVWSTDVQLLGGNVVTHAVFPLVDLKVSAAGASQHKTGLGDVTAGVSVAMHHSAQLHSVLGVDFSLPTGLYEKSDLANIGRNYLSVQPLYTFTYVDPHGPQVDAKLTLNFNQRNSDTSYRSGNEFFLDYSVGWGVGHGWTLGVGGHAWKQLTNDTVHGLKVPNSRVSAYSVGPSIKYDNAKGWFLTAKWQADIDPRNTTKGSAFWVKALIPF